MPAWSNSDSAGQTVHGTARVSRVFACLRCTEAAAILADSLAHKPMLVEAVLVNSWSSNIVSG